MSDTSSDTEKKSASSSDVAPSVVAPSAKDRDGEISQPHGAYAIVVCGGRQHQVRNGDIIKINALSCDVGETVTLDEVLAHRQENGQLVVGAPHVEGVCVRATVLEHMRSRKILVFKRRRRKDYRRKATHRQDLTVLRIEAIA